MKLTPMDINNKEFKRGLRGYNIEEVDEFIDEIIENYEELYKDNAKIKEKLSNATEQIEHYTNIENTIQNTLIMAQNAADQAKSTAKKEAEMLVTNANEAAQRIMDKAHNDVLAINDEYEALKQEFIKFRAKFRNFMNTQLETFDDLEKDILKNYNVSKPLEENDSKFEINEEKIEEENKEENKEVKIDFSEDNIKSIENGILKDDINEIKSFFANTEEND